MTTSGYAVPRVCSDCPFRRTGGIRLGADRIREIVGGVLGEPGASFACHKTTGVAGKRRTRRDHRHCAGALVFAERHQHATQLTRIAERLGFYDAAALLATPEAADVFPTRRAMLATALDRRRRCNPSRSRLRG